MNLIIIIGIFILFAAWNIWWSSPQNIGKRGERRVARKLDWLSQEYITLNDLLLPTRYGTTQIDHVVVSPYGIFVIETKNYKGWIFGHENSEEWKQSLYCKKNFWGRSSKQYILRNPIRQNLNHARAIKTILKEVGDFVIIPIVVFSNNAELHITTPNYIVINWRKLRSVIKSRKTPCISPDSVQMIVNKIAAANITTKESRKIHVRNIKSSLDRRNRAIKGGKCPQCDGELIKRKGKHGVFLGCSNYPRCRFTRSV